jgi:hypothetical protein
MITVQLQIKDTAGMNGWHGSAHSVITHVQQRTASIATTARSRLLFYDNRTATTKMYAAGMNGWHGLLVEHNAHMQQHCCSTTRRNRLWL